jgi:GNAT superfamily N-acetyltransferase
MHHPTAPATKVLVRLPDQIDERHSATRAFCLEMIQQYYQTEYREDWHSDLDFLLNEQRNWFSKQSGGGFWIVQNGVEIIGSVGIHSMTRKPVQGLLNNLQNDNICQLVRAYVRPGYQGIGIGAMMTKAAEYYARNLKYELCYLHADANSPNTLRFWSKMGYTRISELGGDFIHFAKEL